MLNRLTGVIFWIFYVSSFAQETPTDPVSLKNGAELIGLKLPNYEAFYGIPFAEPPVGPLRFKNPVSKSPPAGKFKAQAPSDVCAQPDLLDPTGQKILGSEDCLYLNVYRPTTNASNSTLDVLFYLHGGAYFYGSAHPAVTGPSYLMDNGSVILVTSQYRLNTLGFLATGDDASPGNFAMKDQVMALKWVKDNIKSFGGDPDSITIAGQRAGASSVHMLTMSPLSKDLMKGVMVFSGSAIGPWNYPTEDPLALARQHATILNVPKAQNLSTTDLVEELRKIPFQDIIRTVPLMKLWGYDPLTLYRPVVEPAGEGAFLTQSPYSILKKGNYAKVPIVFSLVENEGAIRSLTLIKDPVQSNAYNNDFDNLLPKLMELKLKGDKKNNFTEQIKQRFSLENGLSDANSEAGMQQLYNERSFYFPAYRTLQLHLQSSDAPVFFYKFAYRGEHSFLKDTDDLIYLIPSSIQIPTGLNAADKAASVEFVKFIVNFVLTQKPLNSPQCKKLDPMCDYLKFFKNPKTGALDTKVTNEFDTSMVDFWDQLQEILL